MNNESFYMHPRYDEFTAFLKMLNTDAKITPSTKHLAFDVWKKATGFDTEKACQIADIGVMTTEILNQNTMLKAENDALKSMNDALRESNDILKQALNEVSE